MLVKLQPHEYYKHAAPFGLTKDEYFGCIQRIGSRGLREKTTILSQMGDRQVQSHAL
ncbi:hypothetical protein OROMI_004596 [Orobanche minor]